MKFFFITLGCKSNQYETQSMKESMIDQGYFCAETIESADIIIFNSCAVTSSSEDKLKKLLNRVKRQNSGAIMVLTGCQVQAFPDIAERFNCIDVFLGTSNRTELCMSIKEFLDTKKKIVNIKNFSSKDKPYTPIVKNFDNRTRAFVKIEDGCDRFCSYCIIPFARGPVRSKSLNDVINEIKQLARSYYKEIVLVGINLSAYGEKTEFDLCDAIESVSDIDGIERIRLGSLEPEKFDFNVIRRLSKQKKLCPQFHLSLQSGCDSTLKRMNRRYSTDDYKKIVQNLRNEFSSPAITTDIMVGFPGETEAEFEQSIDFVKEIGFAKMHVFSYSRRPGTKAYSMPDQVAPSIKLERSKKMCEIEFDMRKSFILSKKGESHSVLFESRDKEGLYEGYTADYIPIKLKSNYNLCNKIIKVKTKSYYENKNQVFLIGEGEESDFILQNN